MMSTRRNAFAANVIAARVLMAMVMNAARHETLEYGDHMAAEVALSGLRPLLSGAVAASVADHLDKPRAAALLLAALGLVLARRQGPEGRSVGLRTVSALAAFSPSWPRGARRFPGQRKTLRQRSRAWSRAVSGTET